MRQIFGLVIATLVLALSVGTGYAGTTYRDPFAYCAAVGTADKPAYPYVGERTPEAIARGLQKAFGITDPDVREPFLKNSYWRCMGGQVYACNVGANLPCQEMADTSRLPTRGMADYCQANPDSDFIPAYVTGRATVYQWRCKAGEPAIVKQVTEPDARGYLSNIWYQIQPPAATTPAE